MKKSEQTELTPDFSHLILSIASAALLKMGLDPHSGENEDRNMARYNIDLLSILKEKTKNNLTKEEANLLDSCIQDLQLKFVQTEHKQKVASTEQDKDPSQNKTTAAKQTEEHSQNKANSKKQTEKHPQSKTSTAKQPGETPQNKKEPKT